jgi:hypothetical protein
VRWALRARRLFAQIVVRGLDRETPHAAAYRLTRLYTAGVLDQPSEKALMAELSAMNAGM